MIEYKVFGQFPWTAYKDYLSLSEILVHDISVKIDGIEMNTFHKDFEEEYNKAIVWDKLNG